MYKVGKFLLRGHRREMYFLQLWMLLCWLIPVAVELLAYRYVLPLVTWQYTDVCIFIGSILLNRLLLAPAYCGYHTCCQQLACAAHTSTAVTCELVGNWQGGGTLLRTFFSSYRHPLKLLRRQLYWDIFRLCVCGIGAFGGICLLIYGGGITEPLIQFFCGMGGVFLAVLGTLSAAIFCRMFVPAVYLPYAYRGIFSAMWHTCRRVWRYRFLCLKYQVVAVLLYPVWRCPLTLWGTAFDVGYALLWQSLPAPQSKMCAKFHTRVLGT